MYIHRIVTKGVPGLPDQDLTFYNSFAEEPLKSVLLIGPNGSGKTTLLRIIAALWRRLDHWLAYPDLDRFEIPKVLSEGIFVAVELRDLLNESLWVCEIGRQSGSQMWLDLKAEFGLKGIIVIGAGQGLLTHEQTQTEQFGQLARAASRLHLGEQPRPMEKVSNVVFIPAENRNIFYIPPDHGSTIEPEPYYEWLTNYPRHMTDENRMSLEIMLRNLKVRNPDWYFGILQRINTYLTQNNKELLDFGSSLRLFVQEKGKTSPYGTHPITDLSSGEQQILLLIFMASRWLMPGGILMVDEPDLHMHVSWQQAVVHELERIVSEKKGQLIITSHSPYVWETFGAKSIVNLNPLAEAQSK